MGQVKRDDVLSCDDTKWMSSFVRSVALSGDSTHADAIDEFHRKRFRKISTEDAVEILKELGGLDDGKAVNAINLQDRFWVWETLEEAIIGKIDEMELQTYYTCF